MTDGPTFPLPALVGQDDLRTALVLAALDPAIGGVLLRGEKGSGKTTAARGLAGLLPGDGPFVELPLGAGEDRVVGSLDLRAALGGGEHRFQPGLLAAAHGGVLYVDEVNLLADHLVDVLLDAAATGVHRVERDGVSHAHPARFVLVGSMNPEEGELRPQLLDRFGLSVEVAAPTDPGLRAEAVRRRLAHDADPAAFAATWAAEVTALRARMAAARPAPLGEGVAERVARLCAGAGAEGLRADLVICRAAAALAGWEGRPEAGEDDVRRVAPLALAHRRRAPWGAPPPGADDLEQVLDGTEPDAAGPRPEPGGSGPQEASGAEPPPPSRPPTLGPAAGPATVPAPAAPARRPGEGWRSRGGAAAGEGTGPGRVVGARAPGPEPGAPLAPVATVGAALARRAAGPPTAGALALEEEDLREAVVSRPPGGLVVLAVDASGSMGAPARLAAVAAAARSLLVRAYQRRDRVAVVSFGGTGAEVVVQPTASIEVAAGRLDRLSAGGRTPLAAGLDEARRVVEAHAAGATRALVVVLSDGRATWAADGADPVAASLAAGERLRRARIPALVVDVEAGPVRLGLAAPLARAMGAARVTVPELTGEGLAELIERHRPGAGP